MTTSAPRISFRPRLLVPVLVLFLGTFPHCRGADAPSKIAKEVDIVYAKAGDSELKLDIVRPAEGDGPFPAVLVIHGGGWFMGARHDNSTFRNDLASQGFVTISPQYRLAPKHPFPAQIYDVKAAVRWVKANASKLRIDPERIGAVGFSAGGHLSLLLGLTGEKDGLEGDVKPGEPNSRVQAVVNYFGPSELRADDFPKVVNVMIKDLLGGLPREKPELAAQASPLNFVSADDVPVLTFQGTKDKLVPFSQAVKLSEAMSQAGVPGRVELLIGAGHGWKGPELDHTKAETVAFFNRYLKPEPQK